MTLDQDICYLALQSRDSRFDGLFFTGVKTTGIYCRPICPAKMPLRRNVTFYSCAAAAQEAGFRPCLRCRPETSPGTPAWIGSSASVSRAVRYLNEGYLDDHAVEDLAEKLGLGARHLTRLFREHLGTTPVVMAQTRRAHFARNLLEQTRLPMTQVALAAGFGSARRFNVVMKKVFGGTPTILRQRAKGSASPTVEPPCLLTYRLTYRPPYNWNALLEFVSARAIPGVEHITDGKYRRTISWHGQPGIITVKPAAVGHALDLTVQLPDFTGIIDLVARVRRMFDCGADPKTINQQLETDPWLAHLVALRPGLRLPCAWDPFEMTVRAILGQQISVKGATTIAGRIVQKFGLPMPDGGQPGLTHLFPDPEVLAVADLTGLGLTEKRAATVSGFAKAVYQGELVLEAPHGVAEFESRFTALPGLGPWTAQYVAMRALGEPDAFPETDLGLKHAAQGLDQATNLSLRSENWRPWRSYAALHLWQSLADLKGD